MSYQNLSAQSIAPGEQQLEPFLPAARRLLWPAFILAIANGIFLYGFPTLAKDWFAWSINPPINAAFQGVGYLVGILVTSCACSPSAPGFRSEHLSCLLPRSLSDSL